LRPTFIDAQRPSPASLAWRVGFGNLGALWATRPWQTLWSALGQCFRDPRLRQLFGRYATYCGSSPLAAPATLMLVAHVEQDGVWQVRGGMHEVALALARVAVRHGAEFRHGAHVRELVVERGRCRGVVLDGGERIAGDAVIFNGDCNALAQGLLGEAASVAVPAVPRGARSLSAVTWCLHARTRGFPLAHHNVCFAGDYPGEFEAVFGRRTVTSVPTVYVCAQDRGEWETDLDRERLLVLVNAPPDGDVAPPTRAALLDVERRAFGLLRDCGLDVEGDTAAAVTGPAEFEQLFPATGGALYGRATHGPFATFARPGSRSRLPGLYLAGGSVHPGPGVPMATLSGRRAAERVASDLGL
jgi:1-hydroxycarotenoid 3,4-desaturase